MDKFYVPAEGVESWRLRLAEPDKQWREKYSAFELAKSWQGVGDFPVEVRKTLETEARFEGIELLIGFPEHKVPLPGGTRPSQTDLWALARARDGIVSVAVEGKVEEAFGPTIDEWDWRSSRGREERLRFICELLDVDFPPPGNLRYQLFHRTASAILEAKRFHTRYAVMLVHSFSARNSWFEDFVYFLGLLGARGVLQTLIPVGKRSGVELFLGWAKGEM
jgi:hypothetical protein